jgi:hypothetical protein
MEGQKRENEPLRLLRRQKFIPRDKREIKKNVMPNFMPNFLPKNQESLTFC